MDHNEPYQNYRIAVPPAFEEVFSHFYYAENTSGEAVTKTLVPSYQTIMIFSFGVPVSFITQQNEEVAIDKCLVIGPIKRAFDYTLPPNAKMLVANFKGDAFFRFFGMAAITENFPVHPDELLNENCFTVLWTALSKINNTNDQVNILLDFCQPYLQQRNSIVGQITCFDDDNQSPIKAISAENNLSERAVQLNHKKYLGYSAKEISRYQRFLKAIQLIQTIATGTSKIDWFEIISECGYYDQSQLIHDFKHYLNLSPTKYLKFQQDICNPTP
jgi:AraC-like DNA-binding protein